MNGPLTARRAEQVHPSRSGPHGDPVVPSPGVPPAAAQKWLLAAPIALTFLMSVVFAPVRPLWLDEAVTRGMVRQSTSDLLNSLRDIDAVHGAYYLVIDAWTSIFGSSAASLRMPSAIFMAVACAGVVLLADRLAGRRVAVFSGFAFALLPVVSAYGMEARSYALATALVTWGTYWLVRALQGQRFGWLLYGLTMVLAAWVFFYALLVLGAHAVTVAVVRGSAQVWRSFIAAGAVVVVAAAPVIAVAVGQSAQVSWLQRPDAETLVKAPFVWSPSPMGPLAMLVIGGLLWGVVVVGLARWLKRGDGRVRMLDLPQIALPWLILPVASLIIVSFAVPLYTGRYVLFSAPALALLVGLGLGQMRTRSGVAVGVVLAVLLIPTFVEDRAPAGRDFWGDKEEVISAHGRAGDGVIATPFFYMSVVNASLDDQYLRVQGSNRAGNPAVWVADPSDTVADRLADVQRVWLIPFDDGIDAQDAERYRALLAESSFVLVDAYPAGNATVELYESSAGSS